MPDTMVDIEVITDAVRLACRAPSLHNSQPWRWVADSTVFSYFLTRSGLCSPPTVRAGGDHQLWRRA